MRHKNEIELRLPGPFQRSHQAAIYGDSDSDPVAL